MKKLFYKSYLETGYIALTSVIIISVLLITVTAALSSINYFSRFNVLENEFKQKSANLAEACVDYAFSRLAASPAYDPGALGGECVGVGLDKCKVVSVSGSAVQVQGVYQKSYTNLVVNFDSDFNVSSWQEVENITTALCP